MIRWLPALSALVLFSSSAESRAHDPSQHQMATDLPPEMRLPVIGPAPDFDLMSDLHLHDVPRHLPDAHLQSVVDHTLLTSIVDPRGVLRVQYIGYRFDLEEFRGDLLSLVGEAE